MNHRGIRLVLLSMCLLSAGCALDWKGGPENTGSTTQPAASTLLWQLQPVRMRLFPVSGLVRDGGQRLLSARLEFVDEMDDTLKAVGDLRLELIDGNPQSDGAGGRRIASWDVALRTLEQQKALYDPITRTYHLRLRVDDTVPATGTVQLQATYIPPQGRRLETRISVNLAG